ncbi:MAG: GntR family transcriptional regulator [Oscillospiraceae bacterium]
MIKLDLQSRTPIYEQLKHKICELAAIGQLRPNDQLPSVRSFARDLGINPNTVQKAYQELEREGIIYSVTGKGSFLSSELDLDTQLHQQYLQKIAQATALAKQCGIQEQVVLDTVRKVYEEEHKE